MTSNCMNDLWSLDPKTGEWRALGPPRSIFAGRYDLTLTYDPRLDVLWSLWGDCADGSLRPIYGYDFQRDFWRDPQLVPHAMGSRAGHVSAWDHTRERVLVYGSARGILFAPGTDHRYKLVWIGDPATNTWVAGPIGDYIPERRSHSIAGYDPYLDALIVFGGKVSYYPDAFPNYRPPFVTNEVLAYLLAEGRWERLEVGSVPPRDHAAGGYSPATGSLYVFGGVDTLGSRAPIDSTTLIIPIEVPANFRWQSDAPAKSSRQLRWGRISGAEIGEDVRRVRLMNRSTGRVIQTAQRVQRLGPGDWHVAFGPTETAELEAARNGHLVVAGVFNRGARAFLAPVQSGAQALRSAADGDATLESEPVGMIQARRVQDGWLVRFRPSNAADPQLTIVDVAGRIQARIRGPFRGSPDGAIEYRWDGLDQSGRRLPRGVYFARTGGTRGTEAARIVLL